MDRRVNAPRITLKKLAIDLITPSPLEFSGNPASQRPKPACGIESLKLLGFLSEIAKQSFGAKPRASAVSTASAPPVAPVAPARPAQTPTTTQQTAPLRKPEPEMAIGYSRNEEYRPALQNPDIVRALMGIERDKAAATPQVLDSNSFRHAELPIVEARPKSGTVYARTPGFSTPVLRSE